MTDRRASGRRICGALLLALAWALPVSAQDLRLPLQQGQPDLALFVLSRSEARISDLGQLLLARQGFRHQPGGAALQPLTFGRSLTPTLRHDPNVNDGIPSDRLTLGGIPFTVTKESRAKQGVLLGLQFSQWQGWSYAPGARLRLTQTVTAELEPTHGYHHASAHMRLCAEQPVADWTWLDACLAGGVSHDGQDTQAALTASLGARHLFQIGAGFHQAGLTFSTTATDGYDKTIVQLSHTLLTRNSGIWSISYLWGERIVGENTLRHRLSLDWSGEFAGRLIGLSLAETRTDGASLFGIARQDRKLRVGLTVPVGRVDLGLWAQRDRSTIDAYRGTDAGLSVSFRMNLL